MRPSNFLTTSSTLPLIFLLSDFTGSLPALSTKAPRSKAKAEFAKRVKKMTAMTVFIMLKFIS